MQRATLSALSSSVRISRHCRTNTITYTTPLSLLSRKSSFRQPRISSTRHFSAMPKESTVSNHYESHSNESYDDAYFYEPGAYMENLANLVVDRLHLKGQQRCILDIGGGTGTFAQTMVEKEDSGSKIVVVEPFLDPSFEDSAATAAKDAPVSFVRASAEDFLVPPTPENWRTEIIEKQHGGYDQIMMKEVVHHFKEEDRVGIFRGMKEGLRKTGDNKITPSLLIITRPQIDIDYPLWDQALDVWKKNQPSAEEIEADLQQAGFTQFERFVEPIECSITLSRWQSMVKSRCWSTFSNFTDEELEEACAIIAENARNNPKNTSGKTEQDDVVLRFEDRLIFLEAS